MLRIFENMARTNPRQLCFTAMDAAGHETRYSYHRARLHGAALAQCLRSAGVARGHYVAVELPNGEAWPLLLLAAAYGNFALIGMDPHLTPAERAARYAEIESIPNTTISCFIDQENIEDLIQHARLIIDGEAPGIQAGLSSDAGSSENDYLRGKVARAGVRSGTGSSDAEMARGWSSNSGTNRRNGVRASFSSGPIQGSYAESGRLGRDATKLPPSQLRRYSSDSEEAVVHFADHSAHLFDGTKPAVVLFTAGVSGKSKPVCLSWKNVTEAAKSLNSVMCKQGRGVWQAVLPFYRVMGLQVIVRSICNRSAFAVYECFQPDTLLRDVDRLGATHIAVDDAMVAELLMCENQAALRRYSCLLLGGSALDHSVMSACAKRRICVYAGYGITETAGHIAIGPIDDTFDGSLRLLPGYEVRIEQAAPSGFGRLLVKGASVCDRYLGMRGSITVNGFLPTGDTAKCHADRITVRGRTDTMFLCGGNNVFPDEIKELLLAEKGVSDAYVFGAPHAALGQCPVAFVERNDRGQQGRPSNRDFAARLRLNLATQLSTYSIPRHVFALDSFPRTSAGRVDETLLERCCSERLEVAKVKLHHVAVPLASAAKIGGKACKQRESLLVEIVDYAGRTGIGECVAFSSDDSGFETLKDAEEYLANVLAPHVIGQAFLHPGEVFPCLMECPDAQRHVRSVGALEPAFWDLYGKVSGLAFWQLIGGRPSSADGSQCRVRAAAVVGLVDAHDTVEQVWRCVEAGYSCVTLDVCPGMTYQRVRAVRQVFPDLMITLDAHRSFTEETADELRALDEFNISWIEEPLAFAGDVSAVASRFMGGARANDRRSLVRRHLAQLSRFQQTLHTPICLDETVPTLQEAYLALKYPNLRYVVARVGEFGGVRPTLDFVRQAHIRGVHIWVGGMFDLGISRKMHAALQTLPTVEDAGNTGSVLRQFVSDIANPAHTVERGLVTLNKAQAPSGFGCALDRAALERYLIRSIVVE